MTRTIRRTFVLVAALTALGALALSGSAGAGSAACAARTNNTLAKLTECVTLEGVRGHQAALQAAGAQAVVGGGTGWQVIVGPIADNLAQDIQDEL